MLSAAPIAPESAFPDPSETVKLAAVKVAGPIGWLKVASIAARSGAAEICHFHTMVAGAAASGWNERS